VACFKTSVKSTGWTEENHENPQNSRILGGKLNSKPPEYEVRILTTYPPSEITFMITSDLNQPTNPGLQTRKPAVRDAGRNSVSAVCKGEINLIREGEQGAAECNYCLPVRRRLEGVRPHCCGDRKRLGACLQCSEIKNTELGQSRCHLTNRFSLYVIIC
jgi:hypothetical protein